MTNSSAPTFRRSPSIGNCFSSTPPTRGRISTVLTASVSATYASATVAACGATATVETSAGGGGGGPFLPQATSTRVAAPMQSARRITLEPTATLLELGIRRGPVKHASIVLKVRDRSGDCAGRESAQ